MYLINLNASQKYKRTLSESQGFYYSLIFMTKLELNTKRNSRVWGGGAFGHLGQ